MALALPRVHDLRLPRQPARARRGRLNGGALPRVHEQRHHGRRPFDGGRGRSGRRGRGDCRNWSRTTRQLCGQPRSGHQAQRRSRRLRRRSDRSRPGLHDQALLGKRGTAYQ
ncbi:MAG: hypothetical protein EOO73_18250 [Myxococcales bacterium]|nr:MAG: hypothetical protein EOO73_18250 [Myxococcales bacterium]